MRVLTYYEEAQSHEPKEQQELLRRFIVSWKRQGFAVDVVGRRDAEANPAWLWFAPWAMQVPTFNPRAFENACWLRWLALAPRTKSGEVFVFADYDMVNLSFTPRRVNELKNLSVPVNLDGAFTAGPFILTHGQACALPLLMRMVMTMEAKLTPDQKHFGDMMVWRAIRRYHPDMVVFEHECELYAPGQRPPIVHVANPAVGPLGMTKLEAWDTLQKD